MANVIIKSEDNRRRENKILRDFGHNPRTANKATRELAEATARKTTEAINRMEREQR